MSKKIYRLLLMLPLLGIASCIEDDSTYGEESMIIEISGIEDIYNVVSYSGEHLQIRPEVKTSFPESDMEYEWSWFERTAIAEMGDTLTPVVISREKNLDYESKLADGDYSIIFKAGSKSTGYTVAYQTTVYAASALSKGFYVLKETPDGQTDVDLYNPDNGQTTYNVIANVQGCSLSGSPLHLDIVSNQAYLDSIKGIPAADNLMSITTTDGNVRWIRVRDCKIVKTAEDCHYEPVAGEMAYRTVRISQAVFFLTSTGVYTGQVASGIGTFGSYVYGSNASSHLTSTSMNTLIYWNPNTRSIGMVDGVGNPCSVVSRLTEEEERTKYSPTYQQRECLFLGQNTVNYNDRIVAVMQSLDNPDERVLFHLSAMSSLVSLMSVRELAADSHFAQAQKYAINARQATLLYCLHNNQVYSLNLSDASQPEEQLKFEGLPSTETITYLANKYTTAGVNIFNYLVVGTQSTEGYRLYFYETVGGKPEGNPKFTISGTGQLRNVEYTDPQLTRFMGYGVQDD